MVNLANPTTFVELTRRVLPWLVAATAMLFVAGLWLSFVAPPDYQQGETVKIMYLHVPAAWMATFVYGVMTLAALGTLVWRHPLADAAQKAAAPLGAGFTFICLVTGSLWGKPMWGTYWVWDARLTSVLVLFILYLGLIALWRAIDDPGRAARAAAILTLVGAVDLPIIKFSVDWWNTLHQPASVFRLDGPTIAPELLMPLLVMSLAFTCLFLTLAPGGDPQRNPAPANRSGDDAGRRRRRPARAGIGGEGRVTGDPHIGFIVAAYAVAAFTIAAMIAWVVVDARRLNAELARGDAGARRRACRREGRLSAHDRRGRNRYLRVRDGAGSPTRRSSSSWRSRGCSSSGSGAGDPASIPSVLIGQIRAASQSARHRRRARPDRRRPARRPRQRGQRIRLLVRAVSFRASISDGACRRSRDQGERRRHLWRRATGLG